jgi:hypothetical protein
VAHAIEKGPAHVGQLVGDGLAATADAGPCRCPVAWSRQKGTGVGAGPALSGILVHYLPNISKLPIYNNSYNSRKLLDRHNHGFVGSIGLWIAFNGFVRAEASHPTSLSLPIRQNWLRSFRLIPPATANLAGLGSFAPSIIFRIFCQSGRIGFVRAPFSSPANFHAERSAADRDESMRGLMVLCIRYREGRVCPYDGEYDRNH